MRYFLPGFFLTVVSLIYFPLHQMSSCSELYLVENGIEYRWQFPSNESERMLESAYTVVKVLGAENSDQMVMVLYDNIEDVYPLVTASKATPDDFTRITSTGIRPLEFTLSPDGVLVGEKLFFQDNWRLALYNTETHQPVGGVISEAILPYDWVDGHTLIYVALGKQVEMTDFAEVYEIVTTFSAPETVTGLSISPDEAQVALLIESETHQLGILALESGDLQRIELPGIDSKIIGWFSDAKVVVKIWNSYAHITDAQIMLADLETGTLSALDDEFQGAVVSPSGDKIALYTLVDEARFFSFDLYVYDGQQTTRVNNEPVSVATTEGNEPLNLYWSPDETRLGFSAVSDDNFEVFTLELATQITTRLTGSSSADYILGWLSC